MIIRDKAMVTYVTIMLSDRLENVIRVRTMIIRDKAMVTYLTIMDSDRLDNIRMHYYPTR